MAAGEPRQAIVAGGEPRGERIGARAHPIVMRMFGAFGGVVQLGLVGPVIMAALRLVWRQWVEPATAGR